MKHSRIIGFAALVVLAGVSGAAAAADGNVPLAPSQQPALPAWMTPELIEAAVAMDLTAAQKPKFNTIVGQFITDSLATVQREIRREAPDLEMRIKGRTKALTHHMDDAVHEILTEEQWPAFERYKKALSTALSNLSRSS